MIPQLIYIALGALGLGMSVALHGSPKEGKHNAFTSLVAMTIVHGLLYWGGFYDRLLGAMN